MKPRMFFSETHTIMCLMALFQSRVKELQIGPDSWIKTKEEGATKQYEIKTFGIPASYRHFMSGIAWDINIRSTLAKHTTGLCQLALLSQSNNNLYSNKNKVAVERAFSFIPQIQTITNFIQNNNATKNTAIIQKMANIVALHGDKSKRRCSPPFSSIYSYCVKDGVIVDSKLNDIGFSSKKAVLLYNTASKIVGPKADKDLIKQLYYHCFFGTHGEDIGILKGATNFVSWKKRRDFN